MGRVDPAQVPGAGVSGPSSGRLRVVCIVGTRPEAIKMAPVILELAERAWAEVVVVATAQHRELADEVFSLFGIRPAIDLNLMQPGQTLVELSARALTALDRTFAELKPDVVIAQGDTTTVLTAAMACFYRGIPFLHLEAGLRSFDLQNPYPEEFNRIVASRLARLHFAPTAGSRRNLLNERVPDEDIVVTGNTVIDALQLTAAKDTPPPIALAPNRRLVLVTVHRRENFGEPLKAICAAIATLVREHPDIEVLWPVHPNPNVKPFVQATFAGTERIHLADPLPYGTFVAAMKHAFLILSDSGGVQEEAPALGRPVLVLRTETERPEAIEAGVVRLVGTDTDAILAHARELLNDGAAYARMARGVSPYGDGQASRRLADAIEQRYVRA
jgi:UDP-N-acetylglucosamine 2-epimerase (non-hydrolysing)